VHELRNAIEAGRDTLERFVKLDGGVRTTTSALLIADDSRLYSPCGGQPDLRGPGGSGGSTHEDHSLVSELIRPVG
jgi:hypothetical protein